MQDFTFYANFTGCSSSPTGWITVVDQFDIARAGLVRYVTVLLPNLFLPQEVYGQAQMLLLPPLPMEDLLQALILGQ